MVDFGKLLIELLKRWKAVLESGELKHLPIEEQKKLKSEVKEAILKLGDAFIVEEIEKGNLKQVTTLVENLEKALSKDTS